MGLSHLTALPDRSRACRHLRFRHLSLEDLYSAAVPRKGMRADLRRPCRPIRARSDPAMRSGPPVARERGEPCAAPLASALKVASDSSDGEGGGGDCVPLRREHFDLASCSSGGHGCLDLGAGIAGYGGMSGPDGHFGSPGQTLPLDGDGGSDRSEVGLKLDMVASYWTILMVAVARWMVALVGADRWKVKVPGLARLQLRRSTRTNWRVWPGVKVRVPAVLPGLGTPT